MRTQPPERVVRVECPREEVQEATRVAGVKLAEGYSPEALVLAVDEVLHNLPLSRAIVLAERSRRKDSAPRRSSVLPQLVMPAATFVGSLWCIVLLFRIVEPRSSMWVVLLVVLGQSILVRMALGSIRRGLMFACDTLNEGSYPTNLHRNLNDAGMILMIRLRRINALMKDTTNRIVAGSKPNDLETELAEINLMPAASRLLVRWAKVNAALRDYLPPYQPRWIGYVLALAFLATVVIGLARIGDRLAEGYQSYAIMAAAWIAGDLSARPRKPRTAGLSTGEPPEL